MRGERVLRPLARLAIPMAVLAVLSGCAGSGRMYAWGSYEETLYAHYRNPQDQEKHLERLKQIVDEAEATGGGKVPPGLYADYGMALYEAGNTKEALAYFGKEKEKWPESTVIMDKMIRNVQRHAAVSNGAQSPAAGTAQGTGGGTR